MLKNIYILLFLMISGCSNIPPEPPKVESFGIAGVKIGQYYNTSSLLRDDSQENSFYLNDYKIVYPFKEYRIYVSPVTNKVYSIAISSFNENDYILRQEYTNIKNILINKYGQNNLFNREVENFKFSNFSNINHKNFKISLSYIKLKNGLNSLSLIYLSEDLQQKMNEDKINNF